MMCPQIGPFVVLELWMLISFLNQVVYENSKEISPLEGLVMVNKPQGHV
jgi:hypothetical protein